MNKILFLSMISIFAMVSCTQNEMAKNYGGTASINLPAGQKLVTITWKDQQLWYLTRKMNPSDSAESYIFKEESSYGIIEGSVILNESK